jgi:hypothetical protein
MGFLLAGLCAAGIALAAVAFVRGRHGGEARLFNRPLHRPRMWATGVVCLALSGLLRVAKMQELIPAEYTTASVWAFTGLSAAFLAILVTHMVLQIRAEG